MITPMSNILRYVHTSAHCVANKVSTFEHEQARMSMWKNVFFRVDIVRRTHIPCVVIRPNPGFFPAHFSVVDYTPCENVIEFTLCLKVLTF